MTTMAGAEPVSEEARSGEPRVRLVFFDSEWLMREGANRTKQTLKCEWGRAGATVSYETGSRHISATDVAEKLKSVVPDDRDVVFLGNCGRVTAGDGTPVPFSHEEIVAHTLFSNAAGIRCIAAPKTDAFDQYDALLRRCLECHEHELILISLGPTATVLAFDLAIHGRQVIDFGQILMIYEFFRSGATRRPT